ncbi:MAG: DUF1302 domain-containing protein, partial [Acidobacteriota bacterium]|nr:DUF1302 domain-containing protein [Acidobacteriota bacterium]
FFSTTDVVGAGGRRYQLGFGADAAPDLGSCFFDTPTLSCDMLPTDPNVDGNDFHEDFLAIIRGPDRAPGDGGEYGAAFRVVASRLNETEFGFYFINYHSRLPVLSGTTGTARAVATARNAFRFFARVPGITPTEARALALDVYVPATSYFADYPEDIELYGFSVSSAIGRTAIRGEVSRRKDAPLQVDDVELLLAVLSPVTFNPAFKENQLGAFGPSEEITGFIRRETTQAQATVTRILGPLLGADTSVVVGEAAFFKVHDMPAKDTLRLEGPATFTSGNPLQATSPNPMNPSFPLGGSHQGKPAEPASAFPDASSWGYRLAGRLEYDNAIGPINLLPRFSWQHDVSGTSPGPGGPFIDGRQALTLGVSGTYQNTWEADISWTGFSGADRRNLLADRDFVSASIKYSF